MEALETLQPREEEEEESQVPKLSRALDGVVAGAAGELRQLLLISHPWELHLLQQEGEEEELQVPPVQVWNLQ